MINGLTVLISTPIGCKGNSCRIESFILIVLYGIDLTSIEGELHKDVMKYSMTFFLLTHSLQYVFLIIDII